MLTLVACLRIQITLLLFVNNIGTVLAPLCVLQGLILGNIITIHIIIIIINVITIAVVVNHKIKCNSIIIG